MYILVFFVIKFFNYLDCFRRYLFVDNIKKLLKFFCIIKEDIRDLYINN